METEILKNLCSYFANDRSDHSEKWKCSLNVSVKFPLPYRRTIKWHENVSRKKENLNCHEKTSFFQLRRHWELRRISVLEWEEARQKIGLPIDHCSEGQISASKYMGDKARTMMLHLSNFLIGFWHVYVYTDLEKAGYVNSRLVTISSVNSRIW